MSQAGKRPSTKRLIIELGARFGRLTVTGESEPVSRTPHRGFWRMIKCRCDCGGVITTRLNSLRSGRVNSCGCLVRETSRQIGKATATTHGDRAGKGTAEYRAWHGIKQRCTNPQYKEWKYYGARGITICDRWRNDYSAFLRDVGRRSSPAHSIDRIDNNGHYEPGNVRWATKSQQAFNRRRKGTA